MRVHGRSACVRRLLLTSAANAQQQQHASAAACARTLLHSPVHAIRALTWSGTAALPVCAARQFEFVRQREAAVLRNCCSLAVRMQTHCNHEIIISRQVCKDDSNGVIVSVGCPLATENETLGARLSPRDFWKGLSQLSWLWSEMGLKSAISGFLTPKKGRPSVVSPPMPVTSAVYYALIGH